MPFTLHIPLRTTTGLNAREHFWARRKRWERERWAVKVAAQRHLLAAAAGFPPIELPCVVELTRMSPRLADLDNVAGGMKAVRDELAELLGVDDGDRTRVQWLYRQEKGPFGVRVAIHSNSRLETRIVPAEEAAP
ncbi:MAG TPA: hypothetical protein VMB50_20725 [Myxococcales bacterium]|nr:hypothetical protein [Myxococcales bacterium]